MAAWLCNQQSNLVIYSNGASCRLHDLRDNTESHQRFRPGRGNKEASLFPLGQGTLPAIVGLH